MTLVTSPAAPAGEGRGPTCMKPSQRNRRPRQSIREACYHVAQVAFGHHSRSPRAAQLNSLRLHIQQLHLLLMRQRLSGTLVQHQQQQGSQHNAQHSSSAGGLTLNHCQIQEQFLAALAEVMASPTSNSNVRITTSSPVLTRSITRQLSAAGKQPVPLKSKKKSPRRAAAGADKMNSSTITRSPSPELPSSAPLTSVSDAPTTALNTNVAAESSTVPVMPVLMRSTAQHAMSCVVWKQQMSPKSTKKSYRQAATAVADKMKNSSTITRSPSPELPSTASQATSASDAPTTALNTTSVVAEPSTVPVMVETLDSPTIKEYSEIEQTEQLALEPDSYLKCQENFVITNEIPDNIFDEPDTSIQQDKSDEVDHVTFTENSDKLLMDNSSCKDSVFETEKYVDVIDCKSILCEEGSIKPNCENIESRQIPPVAESHPTAMTILFLNPPQNHSVKTNSVLKVNAVPIMQQTSPQRSLMLQSHSSLFQQQNVIKSLKDKYFLQCSMPVANQNSAQFIRILPLKTATQVNMGHANEGQILNKETSWSENKIKIEPVNSMRKIFKSNRKMVKYNFSFDPTKKKKTQLESTTSKKIVSRKRKTTPLPVSLSKKSSNLEVVTQELPADGARLFDEDWEYNNRLCTVMALSRGSSEEGCESLWSDSELEELLTSYQLDEETNVVETPPPLVAAGSLWSEGELEVLLTSYQLGEKSPLNYETPPLVELLGSCVAQPDEAEEQFLSNIFEFPDVVENVFLHSDSFNSLPELTKI